MKAETIRCRRLITGTPDLPPLDDGCLIHGDGIIHEVGTWAKLKKNVPGPVVDLGEVTVVPGLVNAHCHLKLAKLEGKTVSGQGFVPWLLSMLHQNYQATDMGAVETAVRRWKRTGLCAVGDILTVRDMAIPRLLATSGIYYTCFCEAFGFLAPDPPARDIPCQRDPMGMVAGAGHALHTTRPDLLQAIKKRNTAHGLPFSIHLAEHRDETGMLMGRRNAFYRLLEKSGFLGHFIPPMKRPVAYARHLGLLDKTTLAVHCVDVTPEEIDILAETGTRVCLCPRSNAFIGVGRAPWEAMLDAGICISLATDSIASNHDLDLWNELAFFLQRLERSLDISGAVALITANPAGALGLNDRVGTLERGKVFRYAVMPADLVSMFS